MVSSNLLNADTTATVNHNQRVHPGGGYVYPEWCIEQPCHAEVSNFDAAGFGCIWSHNENIGLEKATGILQCVMIAA